MTEQPSADSATPEERLASFFGAESQPAPTPAPEVAAEAEEQAEEVPQADEVEPTDEETFEIDGVEYKLPRELKQKVSEWREGNLRQQDYTQKTQALAELHRQANKTAEMLQLRAQFDEKVSEERTELAQIKSQIEQYKKLDWSNFDTDQYIKLRHQMDALKERATELDQSIGKKQGELREFMERNKREVIEAGQKYLQQTIKGWGQEHVKDVVSAAKDVGYSDAEIEAVLDPRFVRMAWEAAQFRKLQANKPNAVQTAQKAPPVVKPGAVQGSKAAAERVVKDARERLRKSGRLEDAAALFYKLG